jgi:hypothetical protein
LHDIINDELKLWEEELKTKEQELKTKEKELEKREKELEQKLSISTDIIKKAAIGIKTV